MRAFHMEQAFSRALPALLKLWHLDRWGDKPCRGAQTWSEFPLDGCIWQGISACSVIILESYRLVSFFIHLTSMDS